MAKAVFHFVSGKSICLEDEKSVQEYFDMLSPSMKQNVIGFMAADNKKFIYSVNQIEYIEII